jgi:predicted hydrocarbon binding protein
MKERHVKGAVLIGYMKFIRNTWFEKGLEEFLSATRMPPDIREDKWYNDSWSSKTLEWIAETKGEEYLEKSGKYAIMNLGEMSRIVEFLDIESILKRGSESYRNGFDDGDFKVELKDETATIKITGSAVNDPYACRAWLGVFAGMLEITNTVGTVEEVQCERDEAPHCEFVMEWKTMIPDKRKGRIRSGLD